MCFGMAGLDVLGLWDASCVLFITFLVLDVSVRLSVLLPRREGASNPNDQRPSDHERMKPTFRPVA